MGLFFIFVGGTTTIFLRVLLGFVGLYVRFVNGFEVGHYSIMILTQVVNGGVRPVYTMFVRRYEIVILSSIRVFGNCVFVVIGRVRVMVKVLLLGTFNKGNMLGDLGVLSLRVGGKIVFNISGFVILGGKDR